MELPSPPIGGPCKPPDETTMLYLLQQLVRLQERQLALQEEQLSVWRTRGSKEFEQLRKEMKQVPEVHKASTLGDSLSCPDAACDEPDWEPAAVEQSEAQRRQKLDIHRRHLFAESPQPPNGWQDLQGGADQHPREMNGKVMEAAVVKAKLPRPSLKSVTFSAAVPEVECEEHDAAERAYQDCHDDFDHDRVMKRLSYTSRATIGGRKSMRYTVHELAVPSMEVVQQVLDDNSDAIDHRWSDLGSPVAGTGGLEDGLPSDTATIVRLLLGSAGLLPLCMFQPGLARTTFTLYRCYVGVCILVTAAYLGVMGVVELQANSAARPQGIMYLFALGCLFILWYSLSKALRPGSPTLSMISEMTRRGFAWNLSNRRARIYSTLAVVYTVYNTLYNINLRMRQITTCQLAAASGEDFLFTDFCVSAWPVFLLAQINAHITFFAAMWLVHTLCFFHTHEMFWYSGVLASSLDSDDDEGFLYVLTQAERLVTARLRAASLSWVASAMVFFLASALLLLVNLVYVFVGLEDFTVYITLATTVYGTILFSGLLPFAQVAEAYEHDVFRRLNLTEYCNKSQAYFGQQFLTHLRSLDWGFRVGGVTINMHFFSRLVSAAGLGVVTTVLRSGMSRLSS
eukprot:TRINITY_DN6752_c0_g2_i1.p1 TRINITY_DN6752_c0_g2~~TRINITY_DN6752_c0_g2_i1.p1  ORF type:complete len:626 (-),score=76.78 TRINITY_DN6752_c0_g2_i1:337-2214(-)